MFLKAFATRLTIIKPSERFLNRSLTLIQDIQELS